MASKDLDVVWGLSITDTYGLFAYALHTLFRFKSLVYVVVAGQEDILGSSRLSRERDELRKMCEALERKNYDVEKEFSKMWEDVDVAKYLQEEVDWYDRPSILSSQIEKLSASLANGKKCCKKVSKEVAEACRAFKSDHEDLQQKKDTCGQCFERYRGEGGCFSA